MIRINNKSFSVVEINQLTDYSDFSSFEKGVLRFIKKWNSGAKQFDLHTSGTTGKPKTISFSRHQLEVSANLTQKTFQLKQDQTCLLNLGVEYVAGMMMLVRALHIGMNLVAVEPSSNPLKNIEGPIDFAAFVPLQLRGILEDEGSREKLNQISTVIVGGAAISESLMRLLTSVACAIYHTYGMTETLTHVAVKRLNGENPSSSFRTLEGVSIEKDDRDCLLVKSPVNDNEPLITNDLVELVSENEFKWIGRVDNVINSGGVKISPEKVEQVIGQSFLENGIEHSFFVAGFDDDKLGQQLVCCVEGRIEIPDAVSDFLKKHLSTYEIPRKYVFIPEFERTKTGKINRSATIGLIDISAL